MFRQTLQFQIRRKTAIHVQGKYDHGRSPATPKIIWPFKSI
jgi:hypothetical protein